MELNISGRNVEMSQDVRQYVEKRMSKLQRHFPNIESAKVELVRQSTKAYEHQIAAQVTLYCTGDILRGQERAATVNAAVDAVIKAMDRQVERYKGRLYRSEQAKKSGKDQSIRQVPAAPGTDSPDQSGEEEEGDTVVRVKRFPMKPMTPQEAIQQMELLGHDFFLFYNSLEEQFNVVYRRRVGDYGLIQPELQ